MNSDNLPPEVDLSAVYVHNEGLIKGYIEDWAEEPDGSLKVRISDHWFYLYHLSKEPPAPVTSEVTSDGKAT